MINADTLTAISDTITGAVEATVQNAAVQNVIETAAAIANSDEPAGPLNIKGYIFLAAIIIVGGAFIFFLIKFRKRFAIINEFLAFLWQEKMWWMIPLILILLGMGLLIFFASANAPLAPFIYTFF